MCRKVKMHIISLYRCNSEWPASTTPQLTKTCCQSSGKGLYIMCVLGISRCVRIQIEHNHNKDNKNTTSFVSWLQKDFQPNFQVIMLLQLSTALNQKLVVKNSIAVWFWVLTEQEGKWRSVALNLEVPLIMCNARSNAPNPNWIIVIEASNQYCHQASYACMTSFFIPH